MTWLVAFWGSVTVIAYALAGFPLLVLARAALTSGTHHRGGETPTPWPAISVIVAARNEVSCIGAKLEHLLALDYPSDSLEIIVASDGSDDGTDAAVAQLDDERVRLLTLPRRGKAAALNDAVAIASGEILVFTDANSWFADDALRALVRPMTDPSVGGVAGDQRYVHTGREDGVSRGERAYWSVDRMLKRAESLAGSTISATGAIYAVRRELVEEVPPDVTDDFFISTGVVAAGRRLVFAGDAVAFEPVAVSAGMEFSRKVRVMTRGLTAVRRRGPLLNPRRSGFYAVQLFSHKILRRLVVIPGVVAAVSVVPLAKRRRSYRGVLIGEIGFLSAGVIGIACKDRAAGRWPGFSVPAYTCMVNAAALRACWNTARGQRITRWEPPMR